MSWGRSDHSKEVLKLTVIKRSAESATKIYQIVPYCLSKEMAVNHFEMPTAASALIYLLLLHTTTLLTLRPLRCRSGSIRTSREGSRQDAVLS